MKNMQLKIHKKVSLLIIVVIQICILIGTVSQSVLSNKYLIVFPILFCILGFVSINIKSQRGAFAAILISSGYMTVVLQFATGSVIDDLPIPLIFLNWGLVLGIYILFTFLHIKTKSTILLSSVIVFIFGLADAIVIAFRGNQIAISDFASLKTALSVANNYKFTLRPMSVVAVLLFISFVIFILNSSFEKVGKAKWYFIILVLLEIALISNNIQKYEVKTWENQGCTRNGVLFELLLEIRDLNIKEPENYSVEETQKILNDYIVEPTDNRPNIVIIMSEAFSDLSVLGEIETNIDVMPNYKEICKSSIHGYALSSVFGGNTAVSEWEFLTGNTMAFLPKGSMPYHQYVNEETNSIVQTYNDLGYETIAMHPYLGTGYNRNVVFKELGFDRILFLDDFSQDDLVRAYVSDWSFNKKIIEQFENRKQGNPLFIFGISMQNHGGYLTEGFEGDISIKNIEDNYSDVNQYLSLIHITDESLDELISYFDSMDEEVIVVFFGDHQPKLDDSFYTEIGIGNEDVRKYIIPFFIWDNKKDTEIEIELTSLNYLGTLLESVAGSPRTSYNLFLQECQRNLYAINAEYYKDVDGIHRISKNIENEWISKYQKLQYSNIFDKRIDRDCFQ